MIPSRDLLDLITLRVTEALSAGAAGFRESLSAPSTLHQAETLDRRLEEECIRREMVRISMNLYEMGFFAGTSGNISVRLRENEILITPSGVNKSQLTPEQVVKVDREGKAISGSGKASSEVKMHLFSYSQRNDISAIVHAHPPFATGFAAAGIPLDKPVLPEAILILGSIPLVEYGTPSTHEVPQALAPYVMTRNAFLLAHHGTLTFGRDLNEAAHRTDTLELFAKVILIARMLGGEKLLSSEQLEKLAKAH
jgi:L-fuculose-phosphate aldolase